MKAVDLHRVDIGAPSNHNLLHSIGIDGQPTAVLSPLAVQLWKVCPLLINCVKNNSLEQHKESVGIPGLNYPTKHFEI